MVKKTLDVIGMHCKSCEELISDILSDLDVKVISANFKKGKVEIDFDEKKTKIEKIKQAIETEGDNYKVRL